MSKVGEPEIPYLGINLLIPDGEEAVSVKVERVGLKTITLNNQLVPQQKPAILSRKHQTLLNRSKCQPII